MVQYAPADGPPGKGTLSKMNAQDVILGSRVAHVRELKTEVARLKADNARLREENAELRQHFDMALLAAEDFRALAPDGKFIIVDGWNLILGSRRLVHDRDELVALARRHLDEHPRDFVWIVFDGPKENSRTDGRLRISYTGGTGLHRADRFVCDFLRMARLSGDLSRIEVKTNDLDFAKEVRRMAEASIFGRRGNNMI